MPRLEDRTRMVCRPSVVKTLGLLVMNLAMLGVAWAVVREFPWLPELWIGLVFFSVTLVAIIVHPFKRGDVVIIGPEGIEDRRNRMRPFSWAEIRRIVVVTHQTTRYLAVKVDQLEEHRLPLSRWYPAWLREMIRWGPSYFGLDPSHHVLNLVGLSPGLTEVVAFLRDQMGKTVEEPARRPGA